MTTTLLMLLAGLLARPALAHPGHDVAGWLHHGEPLVLAGAVLAAVVARWLGTGYDRSDRQ